MRLPCLIPGADAPEISTKILFFYHHEISQLSSRESRKSRRRRVASPALVGVRRVFSAGWHTQALARVICEIREIRVKFNHLCVKILGRLPCLIPSYDMRERHISKAKNKIGDLFLIPQNILTFVSPTQMSVYVPVCRCHIAPSAGR